MLFSITPNYFSSSYKPYFMSRSNILNAGCAIKKICSNWQQFLNLVITQLGRQLVAVCNTSRICNRSSVFIYKQALNHLRQYTTKTFMIISMWGDIWILSVNFYTFYTNILLPSFKQILNHSKIQIMDGIQIMDLKK